VGTDSASVGKLLRALLELPPGPVAPETGSFPVVFDEPDTPEVRAAIEPARKRYLGDLSDKQKVYLECSLPRYKFAVDRVVKYLPAGSGILDLGCAPGYLGIFLDALGYRVQGIDLNELWWEEYPSRDWVKSLRVRACDVEHAPLPFPDASLDGVVFAEVLEHVAIAHPRNILIEIRRVLRAGGYLFLTTPNVANLANIITLARGANIFWPPEIFYGGTDRHNREYTPGEVVALCRSAGLGIAEQFLFNGPNNWNGAAGSLMYETLESLKAEAGDSPLLGNTTFVVGQRA